MIRASETMVARPSIAPASVATNERNLSRLECLASLGAGAGLMLSAVRGGAGGRLLRGLAGLALVYRGATGRCLLYRTLGFDTSVAERIRTAAHRHSGVAAGEGVRFEESITVARAPADVYDFWRQLENLPSFMSHLESVRQIDLARSHWVARGPFGARFEWDAEIINERPNELIAWESLPGGEIETAGSVHFTPCPSGFGTVVRVNLKYRPVGGRLGMAIAGLLGQNPDEMIEQDLQQMQRQLEGTSEPAPALE